MQHVAGRAGREALLRGVVVWCVAPIPSLRLTRRPASLFHLTTAPGISGPVNQGHHGHDWHTGKSPRKSTQGPVICFYFFSCSLHSVLRNILHVIKLMALTWRAGECAHFFS